MLCPLCDADMLVYSQNGSDVNYCPDCEAQHQDITHQLERFVGRQRSRDSKLSKRSSKFRDNSQRRKPTQSYKRERRIKAQYQNDLFERE